MSSSSSNIRAFVQWSEQTVFAGDEIDCQITFKNIAPGNDALHSSPKAVSPNRLLLGRDNQRKIRADNNSPVPVGDSAPQGLRTGGSTRIYHRSTLSLNATSSNGRLQQGGGLVGKESTGCHERGRDGHPHRRSVSIVSLGLSDYERDETFGQPSDGDNFRRLSRGHTRSSSLQTVPRRFIGNRVGPLSAPYPQRSATHLLPVRRTTSNVNDHTSRPNAQSREYYSLYKQMPSTRSVPSTPSMREQPSTKRKGSASFAQNFKFPAPTALPGQSSPGDPVHAEELGTLYKEQASSKPISPRQKSNILAAKDQGGPLARILSPTINGDTPRSSAEFYSLSNNSTETLASEYVPPQPDQTQPYPVHSRKISSLAVRDQKRTPETLMMGYAQIHGFFTLDGSLVNQAPFEEIKRKAVFGGQGGGVIGVESSRRDTGLLRGFGWSNIGDSIGGLMGSGELSSIKDMRGIASSKSVPLLTTPQSILFVDLRLAHGESKSYRYTFRLPRGLPPSYRGKAIRISYNLIIGTQRPGGAKEQQVRSVEVPFRVLGSVNEHGELLGHDFMLPYIIMRDQAKIKCLENTSLGLASNQSKQTNANKTVQLQSDLDEFLTYVNSLLARPRQNSNLEPLSPTQGFTPRRQSSMAGPSSAREAIDLAILRSNRATDSQQSANQFEITRNGRQVAVVMLTRPAYRIGETVTVAVDFAGANISCYALHASLETSEKIDSAIALRSNASIHRVTRRIYSSYSESTLFSRRTTFSCNIPCTATPSFITSGVSLEWYISVEFVTPRVDRLEQNGMSFSTELLEEVYKDERSIAFAASEDLECESFEVAVPLQVYGALTGPVDQDEYSGLAV